MANIDLNVSMEEVQGDASAVGFELWAQDESSDEEGVQNWLDIDLNAAPGVCAASRVHIDLNAAPGGSSSRAGKLGLAGRGQPRPFNTNAPLAGGASGTRRLGLTRRVGGHVPVHARDSGVEDMQVDKDDDVLGAGGGVHGGGSDVQDGEEHGGGEQHGGAGAGEEHGVAGAGEEHGGAGDGGDDGGARDGGDDGGAGDEGDDGGAGAGEEHGGTGDGEEHAGDEEHAADEGHAGGNQPAVPFGRWVNSRRVYNDVEKQTIYASLLRRTRPGVLKRGVTKAVAEEFGVPCRVVQRVWKDGKLGGVQNVVNKKHKRCGRKKIPFDPEVIKQIPPSRRTTLKDLANELGVSKSYLWKRFKEGNFKRVSNAIKPSLTEENKKARVRYALSMLEPNMEPNRHRFKDLYDTVFIDEKWFYRTKGSMKIYMANNEEEVHRHCHSKHHIDKVMFLTAVARPRFDEEGNCTFDGKIGMYPFVSEKAAERRSINRERGTMETKPTKVTKAVSRDYMLNKVIPAIKAKWPVEDRGKTINIQQDNAKTHISPDDDAFKQVATSDGFDIRLVYQPANSPDTNILDLGLFATLQSLFQKKSPTSIDDIVTKVIQAWEEFPAKKSNHVFLTHQSCMQEIMRVRGEHHYKIPHLRKGVLESLGILPVSIACNPAVVYASREFVL